MQNIATKVGKPENWLISSLPSAERDLLLKHSEPVDLAAGDVLYEPGDRIQYAYFPSGAVISLVCSEVGLGTLEVGIVGADGLLGVSLRLNIEIADMRALALASGPAVRIEASTFSWLAGFCHGLRELSDRYLFLLMGQLAQVRTCMREHTLEARMARCLLMTRDRAHSDTIHLKPERFAWVDGFERAGILAAARSLQNRNLVRYSRDGVQIVDDTGLEAAACSCYAAEREKLLLALPASGA